MLTLVENFLSPFQAIDLRKKSNCPTVINCYMYFVSLAALEWAMKFGLSALEELR